MRLLLLSLSALLIAAELSATTSVSISNDVGLSRELALPTQAGQSGKFLTTNGSAASWSTVGTGDFLKNGSVAMTGDLLVNAQKDVRFKDADSSNYAAIQAPATIGTNYTLTLPVNDGSSGQFLQTDGSGVLTWATGGGGGGSGDFLADGTVPMTGPLQFGDADASNFISIQPPATVSADYTLTLPTTDGAADQVLATDGSGVLSWKTLPTIDTAWAACTPSGSWSTNTTYTGFCQRVGPNLNIRVKVAFAGAPDNGGLTITLPSSWVIDTSKLVATLNSGSSLSNECKAIDESTNNWMCTVAYGSSTTVSILLPEVSGGNLIANNPVTKTTPFTFGNQDWVEFSVFNIPIVGW